MADYNEAKQKAFLEFLITSESGYTRCYNIIESKYFDEKFRKTVKYIKKYSEEYKVLPMPEQIEAETGIKLTKIENYNERHDQAYLDEIERFCQHKAVEWQIHHAPDLLEKGFYDDVLKGIKDAVTVSLQKDLGLDYFSDPKSRLSRLQNKSSMVPTGWTEFDSKLFGGLNRGEITIFAGNSGMGKSLFLQNLSVNWVLDGLNGIYFTHELSEDLVSLRIDAMITNNATKSIWSKVDEIHLSIKNIQKKAGKLQIKYMPPGTSVNDINAFLKEYEIATGIKIDFVAVDYLDLLHPNNKRVNPSDMFIKDKYVTEELRGLAAEWNFLMITASQLNRCLDPNTILITEDRGKIKLSEVKIGDKILGSEDYVTVKGKITNKTRKFKIKTKSGKEIICSSNHIFPTPNGQKSIDSGLKIKDTLYVRK